MKPGNGKKVFVGLSGGVDSSVSAALLKEAGYDVTGAFIRVWHPDWLPCEWREERRDAMRVAAHLNIPFVTIDLQEEYKKAVADYMIEEYKRGRTPNPDVMCNKEVKFGSFLKEALKMGADYIATGHYAQNSTTAPRIMTEGKDKNKDQTYFLWTLGQKELEHVLFPVGHLEKTEVQALAKKYGLPTAEKKDSQGICFIGKVDMKEFLSHYIESQPGDVLNEAGEIIGTHEGSVFYTIGQRHGFTIHHTTPHDDPYYIVGKNIEKNTIIVSQKKDNADALKRVTSLALSNVNWISGKNIDHNKKYGARIRYRQDQQQCTIDENNVITFDEPQQGVSLGQSVVVYDKEMCLGGGIIEHID